MQWLANLLSNLPHPFSVFAERFNKKPIAAIEELEYFVRTRAAYIAQTAMYGYLKTRMGTAYRKIFEDEAFAKVIHASTVKLFGSCLCDLASFSATSIYIDSPGEKAQLRKLALRLYDQGIAEGLTPESRELLEKGLRERLAQRLETSDREQADATMQAFCWSEEDIVRHAPVIESYKQLDAEIVQNSIRFRWVDVYQQAHKRYAPEALRASWDEKKSAREVAP